MLSQLKSIVQGVLGLEFSRISHAERLVSALGGFVGILGILIVSSAYLEPGSAALIVASMGASAVLLFAVPHGPLSQPWAVVGGHLVSALVGVSCAMFINQTFIAAALAVGLAIGAMHYLRCIHPPGGATAITAVIGGPDVHSLGYQFVITPVMLNVLVILIIAVIFNSLFDWRRYPAWFKRKTDEEDEYAPISHGDLVYALSEIDSFVDISEQDLLRIYSLATRRSLNDHIDPGEIRLWHYYSNGKEGEYWSIRRIVDESVNSQEEADTVIFKVMDGDGYRSTGHVSRQVFARWAKYEVEHDGEKWQRIDIPEQ